jgi:hypothetical protein
MPRNSKVRIYSTEIARQCHACWPGLRPLAFSGQPSQKGESRVTHETFTPAQSEGRQLHPPIVYLVDGDPSFLRAFSRRLQAADYRVETFASAEEFLKSNRSEAAGCMVLDLQIPGLGGLALQK